MKRFIPLITLGLSLSLAAPAHARSLMPRQEQVSMGESLRLQKNGEEITAHTRTSLNNYGELKVVVTFLNSFDQNQHEPITLKKKVSSYNLLTLRDMVLQLSNAELQKSYNRVVCMMMPPWGSHLGLELSVREGLDHNAPLSQGEMREILSPRGCWVGRKVRPLDNYDYEEALKLRETLRTLRNEMLSEIN